MFEKSGHLPYFEEPEKFVQVVEGFLGRRSGQSEARGRGQAPARRPAPWTLS